jgi:hypothetical protein
VWVEGFEDASKDVLSAEVERERATADVVRLVNGDARSDRATMLLVARTRKAAAIAYS